MEAIVQMALLFARNNQSELSKAVRISRPTMRLLLKEDYDVELKLRYKIVLCRFIEKEIKKLARDYKKLKPEIDETLKLDRT